jgi:hypothetical protein
MEDKTILGSLDPELMERATSRRDALRGLGRMGMTAAVASVPVALATMAKGAFAQSSALPADIVSVLNFALALEYLESEFYNTGVGTSGLIPASDRPIFTQIQKHENAHVALLKAALGSSAIAKPTFDFTAGGNFTPFTVYAQFQALSQAFEDTGVRAYKGQAGNLMANKDILTTALQIHSVEARHASEVRRLRGQKGWITGSSRGDLPAATQAVYDGDDVTTQLGVDVVSVSGRSSGAVSEAFDEPLTRAQVAAIANLFIVSPKLS